MRELLNRDQVDVVAFALPNPNDRKALAEFENLPNVEVFWGDLVEFDDVERAIRGVDVVLHLGAVIPPLADIKLELAQKVNLTSIQNLIKAVRALPEPGAVAVVGVGSVAETGDRPPPHHWGRVGDPVRVSRFDEYGASKADAERALVDSGLPRWAWLRQTGILNPGLLSLRDPIFTHTPLGEVLEWVSVEDSARLLASIVEGAPQAFWQDIHNVGGGSGWRLTNWDFENQLVQAIAGRPLSDWFELNWFALDNFHGHWFTDSDRLQELVPFREDSFEATLAKLVASATGPVAWARRVPGWLMKHLVMKCLVNRPRGTMHAVAHSDTAQIQAFFGSLENWQQLGDW